MELEGKISRKEFSTSLASFYLGQSLVAKLKETPISGFKICYSLTFLNEDVIDKELIEFKIGFWKTRFQIVSNVNGFPWIYKRKKWYQILNSTSILLTDAGNVKFFKEFEKFELHLDGECVGTLRFDQGKYRLSFHPKLGLKLCLIASSIFVIENETLVDKTI